MISGLSFGGEIFLIGTGIVCREQETVRFTARLETARLDDRTNRDAREKHRRKRYGVVGVRVRGTTQHTDKVINTDRSATTTTTTTTISL